MGLVKCLKHRYDEWVTLSTRARFKRILAQLRRAAEHRLVLLRDTTRNDVESVGPGSVELWGCPSTDNIVRHLADVGVLLSGDISLRETLYHLHISL